MSSSPHDIPTDPDAIERAIKERQARLAGTVDELVYRVSPKQLAASGKEAALTKVRGFLGQAQEQARGAGFAARDAMTTPTGDPRPERIVAVAAGALSVVLLMAWVSSRRRG